MSPRASRALAAATIATLAGGAAALAAAAQPSTSSSAAAATPRITGAGVGGVKIGKRFTRLRAQGLVGPLRPGCELGGPNTRSAKLRPPLKGTVNFTLTRPRRVDNVTVTGGAKARGVGIGATIAQIKAAFPNAKVDHSTESVFRITLVRIPKDGGGKIKFAVDVNTHKTTSIGVPIIAFCE
jgi:hypothetical protein